MLKSRKKAFSYVELLFGMVMVAVIFSASIPLITKKAASQPALPGTYMCFAAYDNDTQMFRLYETMRRGNNNFSALADVTEDGCNFYKQKNIRTYNVTLIGGGGASNRATETEVSLGQSGQRLSIPNTSLAGVWDTNNRLNIRMCRNNWLKNPVIPYEKEFDYCVGGGGIAHRDSTLGSTGQDEETYTNLLGAYHDVLYEARTNIDTVTYVGLGNGVLDADDVAILNLLSNSAAKDEIINGVNEYLNLAENQRTTARKEDLFEVAKTLRGRILNNNYNAAGNHGGMGGYSRFVLYDTNPLECTDGFGNCVADGGLGGGYLVNNVVSVPNVAEGVENNAMLNNIQVAIEAGLNDDGILLSQLGNAGQYFITESEQDVSIATVPEATCVAWENQAQTALRLGRRATAQNIMQRFNNARCGQTERRVVKTVGDSFVANGGAIVISW